MKKITLFLIFNINFVLAQSSFIDSTFGVNGVSDASVSSEIFDENEIHGFDITDSGKILNLSNRFPKSTETSLVTIVTQHNSNGVLDANFGVNGIVELTNFLGYDLVSYNNNVYVSGISLTDGRLGILALSNTGVVLTTFGNNGLVTINDTSVAIGTAISLDNSDRFIVAGHAILSGEYQPIIARFLNNGNVDTTFGTNGSLRIDLVDNIDDEELFVKNISIFSDNKILVAGNVDAPEDATPTGTYQSNEFLIKTNSNGTLDTNFSNDGYEVYYALTASGGGFNATYILPNNKTLVSYSDSNNNLIRLNVDGTIDTSFGTGGMLSIVGSEFEIEELFKTSLDSDILVLGYQQSDGSVSILKVDEDGNLDTTFANAGVLPIDFPGISSTDLVSNALELADGKLLVSGIREASDGFLMGRYFKENQLSITDNSLLTVRLFPNPSHNFITIESKLNIDRASVYDVNGRLVLKKEFNSNKIHIDISSFKNGIYFIKTTNKNSNIIETIKCIKA